MAAPRRSSVLGPHASHQAESAARTEAAPQAMNENHDGSDERVAGPPSLRASLRVDDPRWGESAVTTIADVALMALTAHGVAPDDPSALDIVFAGDAALAELNLRFRGKDGPTNVLSFPSDEEAEPGEAHFIGGIALAYGVCEREAEARGLLFEHHAAHLLLHGVLHLLGYDHDVEERAGVMERIEIDILRELGIANPYEGE